MGLGGEWRNTQGEDDFGHVLKESFDPVIPLKEIISLLEMTLKTAKSVQNSCGKLSFHNKLLIVYKHEGKGNIAWVKIERRKRGEKY